MTAREELLEKLRELYRIHDEKVRKYQEEGDLPPEVGCLTREGCQIVKLYPQMLRMGIGYDDLSELRETSP